MSEPCRVRVERATRGVSGSGDHVGPVWIPASVTSCGYMSSARPKVRSPIREMTCETSIEEVMWWMNARKHPTLASTRTNAAVTDTCGTKVPVSP